MIADPIELSLPADIAPGQYTIRLGMYDSLNGSRLFILNPTGESVADFVEVGTLKVIAE